MALTYNYECEGCKTHVEVQKSIREADTPEVCVVCKQPMRKIITGGTGFILKGGGWAATGYQKDHVTFKMKDGSSQTVPYNPRLDKGKNE